MRRGSRNRSLRGRKACGAYSLSPTGQPACMATGFGMAATTVSDWRENRVPGLTTTYATTA